MTSSCIIFASVPDEITRNSAGDDLQLIERSVAAWHLIAVLITVALISLRRLQTGEPVCERAEPSRKKNKVRLGPFRNSCLWRATFQLTWLNCLSPIHFQFRSLGGGVVRDAILSNRLCEFSAATAGDKLCHTDTERPVSRTARRCSQKQQHANHVRSYFRRSLMIKAGQEVTYAAVA